jgi:hypothetical protein
MDLSSFVFISAMSMINADGNITSISLQNTTGVSESNPLAAPLARGDTHYINSAAAISACIFAHDELKDLDRRLGLKDSVGTRDVFTIGVTAFEYFTISTWVKYQKADIGWELGLSETEFLITSSIFNIEF